MEAPLNAVLDAAALALEDEDELLLDDTVFVWNREVVDVVEFEAVDTFDALMLV